MVKRQARDLFPAYFTYKSCTTCKKRTEQLTDGKKDGYRYCIGHGGKP